MGPVAKVSGHSWPPGNPRLLGKGRAKTLTPCTLVGTLTYKLCCNHPLPTHCSFCLVLVPVVFW